mgnify:FL=1|jgi:hypothetical protein
MEKLEFLFELFEDVEFENNTQFDLADLYIMTANYNGRELTDNEMDSIPYDSVLFQQLYQKYGS